MAAPSETTLFTIRIVSLDYYMAAPIPGFDICYSSLDGDQYMKALMTALEKALNQNVSTTKRSVHGYSLVRAKKIYGFHPLEDLFIKIYLYPHISSSTSSNPTL
ncbi:hypothetical protein ZIOFF_054728 [Zingiber officinale]|uniref:DNA polymerase delta/zeta catalytic subunit N-terminal domain-containing protein n=1 Tax=Zingiber officinale TaxID=94328 RepID=A0A8J5FI42_ZINOF|nr:hypothetical protein ZIOFF_054728 [Zingiber officinale]